MSKIRQAVAYEHRLAEERSEHNRKLLSQADEYEHALAAEQVRFLEERIAGAIAIRNEALAYERKITDSEFANINHINEEHRVYHEREHVLYDDAVEKASASLSAQLSTLQVELDRMAQQMQSLLPVGRFEREHAALIERIDTKFATYDEKIAGEHDVTVRQDTTQDLLNRIAESSAVQRRWMIGLAVSTGATFLLLFAHILKLY